MAIEPRGFGTGIAGLSQPLLIVIIVFLAIALYNVVELHCIIWGTFKRHSGLYYWSFLFSTWGIALYCIGFLAKFFVPPWLGYLACTVILIGWIGMITGQSMVLWSRLHLILWNQTYLKLILWMIIINTVLIDLTITPMFYGSFSSNPEIWRVPYSIMEKVEVTTFFVQETIISGFYIAETLKLIKLERSIGNTRLSRRLLHHLVLINVIIIILDMTIIALEYTNQYNIQTSYKPFVYSIKLKLEFTILNRLVEITSRSRKEVSSGQTRDYTTGDNNNAGTPDANTSLGLYYTGINSVGVDLEAFIEETINKPLGCATCQASEAYAMGYVGGPSIEAQTSPTGDSRNGITKVTEVIVEHVEMQEADNDAVSVGKRSSLDLRTMGGATVEDKSKASSEVDLANCGV